MTGILLVDKPAGMTSHDVVDRIRKVTRQKRVGHTGTLDPGATGLLILCIGKATRLSEHLTGLDKVYQGRIRFGQESSSYDLDGELIAEKPVPPLTREQIQALCSGFTGVISQIPPMVSAVKIGGERLYKKARKGEVVDRPARTVTVHAFEVLSYTEPEAEVRVACTSGTYVRSLAHDLGELAGCGALLASLRRTAVGRHSVEAAATLEALQSTDDVYARLIPMGEALDLPCVIVERDGLNIIATGGVLLPMHMVEGCPVNTGWVQIQDKRGQLLALGTVDGSPMGAMVQPKRVFLSPGQTA
ncbi:MAG: tRNA pseudouridine(55) synthase TruB [Candidatus Hydrogenedentes bacterium]|nr:tRNA pseudouridine(55) synthase TruB [Candidatus Hydrogenedentota bacterium]